MKAFIFPGQGSQFPGMGSELNKINKAKEMFNKSNEILGFNISEIMFKGTMEELKQTNVTQPAIFIHSIILSEIIKEFNPDMVAGHSLGEISALAAAKVISFEEGLDLVKTRSEEMQIACENTNSTMAAVLQLDGDKIEDICSEIDGIVVPANYNCPGQIVISGELKAIQIACDKMIENGARRAIILPVGGAFHSPIMESAKEKLANKIDQITFKKPICPIYQNVSAQPVVNTDILKRNLIEQLISPVKWNQTIENMIKNGASNFTEIGPGKVLQGLIKKINPNVTISSFLL
ncbi:MAG: [acyl-carrier-protein] S-malonyltransferase [Flavobacteriales bacterium TMED113]|nr:MAG: [acyl-carrier-protein] S-malonyltransferase [Flavobacteriales bacterium TMED113]|tara:strand:- start:446 stop:1321 length:876 start_codon:yes stop_codon:yes gene_type:complete